MPPGTPPRLWAPTDKWHRARIYVKKSISRVSVFTGSSPPRNTTATLGTLSHRQAAPGENIREEIHLTCQRLYKITPPPWYNTATLGALSYYQLPKNLTSGGLSSISTCICVSRTGRSRAALSSNLAHRDAAILRDLRRDTSQGHFLRARQTSSRGHYVSIVAWTP